MKLFVFLQSLLTSLREEEQGATMVEYGLIVAAIAVVVGAAATTLGGEVAALFEGLL
jgi:pilus assembly protein Flp/PilA